jgi:hypothetical protein
MNIYIYIMFIYSMYIYIHIDLRTVSMCFASPKIQPPKLPDVPTLKGPNSFFRRGAEMAANHHPKEGSGSGHASAGTDALMQG